MWLCSFSLGMQNRYFETKFQSDLGILDPEEILAMYLYCGVFINENKKLESSYALRAQKSPTAIPLKSTLIILFKYGRNLPNKISFF